MRFRFYLDDIEIDEPIGFDATKIKLKRSENWHGVMSETSEETIEFYGSGFDILSGLYAVSGIDAVCVFKVEYYCNDELQEDSEYNITFYEYEEFCGNDCYCKVGIERTGCFYQFKNAMDTKVDLDATVAIDKTTVLGQYEYLGKEIEIPSKTIVLTSKAESTENNIEQDYTTDINAEFGSSYTGVILAEFWIPFETDVLTELEEFVTLPTWDKNFGAVTDEVALNNYFYKNAVTDIQCLGNDYSIIVKSQGRLSFTTTATLFPFEVRFILTKRVGSVPTILLQPVISNTGSGFDYIYEWDVDSSLTETLNEDDLLLCYIIINGLKTTTGNFSDFIITHEFPSSLIITTDSTCDPSNAKLYLVNETLSHISEYVTNNCLRVYSEYLGRTDSQPYNIDTDGCGGLLGLTNGLFLRRIEDVKTGAESPILALSFNDVINAVNCIEPLGFTIEQHGNVEVIRIEDWKYFYNDTVVVNLGTVSVKKTPNLKLHFKNFKTGYSKYEAEEYNGLDEFLTEREYTTSLVNHNGVLEKVCKFIASGYAIEITRRKGNINTKDWRFDNDTFVIALKRTIYIDELDVEQGNITDADNIIDPATILNFRISPARMAMKWFQYVTTFLKGTKELLFASGKGNTAAEGELVGGCNNENGVISEKQNLVQTNFTDSQDGIFIPELHNLDKVPFTFQQYKSVRANPEGLFAYKCDDVQRYGWLQEFSYSFVDGEADIVLIPRV